MNNQILKNSLIYGGMFSAFALTMITLNNYNLFEYNCDKAIIYDNNIVKIVDVLKCTSYSKSKYKIITKNNDVLITDKSNTKLLSNLEEANSYIKNKKLVLR